MTVGVFFFSTRPRIDSEKIQFSLMSSVFCLLRMIAHSRLEFYSCREWQKPLGAKHSSICSVLVHTAFPGVFLFCFFGK